jgi:LPXTG-site transpeptidase (sortase) family protein
VEDEISDLVLPESEPGSVTIPRIDVESELVELGLEGGAMEVPVDPADAGWYELGPTPGALGPAVIAGHVTWNRAPAVFFRLSALRAGDRVLVSRVDGTTAVFSVTRVQTFSKARFPTRAVYGPVDHAGLRLITCGGEYDGSSHRYADNVVAFAELVDVQA